MARRCCVGVFFTAAGALAGYIVVAESGFYPIVIIIVAIFTFIMSIALSSAGGRHYNSAELMDYLIRAVYVCMSA